MRPLRLPVYQTTPFDVDVDAVRVGAVLDLVALELLGARIEPGDVVAGLADEPDLAVGSDRRVAGAAAPFDGPFLDVHARGLLGRDRRGPRRDEHGAGE